LSSDWSETWSKLISGKTLIDDLYSRCTIKLPKLELKKKVIDVMIKDNAEEIRLMKSIILDILSE
jgi:hypothetical protein